MAAFTFIKRRVKIFIGVIRLVSEWNLTIRNSGLFRAFIFILLVLMGSLITFS